MIKQFRAVWHNEPSEVITDEGNDAGAQFGPRSAGKVARWSMERVADILKHNGRGTLKIERDPATPMTPHEHSLSLVLERLSEGDQDRARQHAQWLVDSRACDALLRALHPVSMGPARLALMG